MTSLRRGLFVLLLATSALAVACAGDADASPGPTDGPTTGPIAGPTAGPITGTPPDAGGRTAVPAPIEDVELVVRESYPVQYAVKVTSGLPSGCAEYRDATLERDGATLTITVTNTMPASDRVACTMIYGYTEHTVELGTDFESGSEYTVHVNDRTITFVAQ